MNKMRWSFIDSYLKWHASLILIDSRNQSKLGNTEAWAKFDSVSYIAKSNF